MQAIILAGGFGTRLQSAVGHIPKPMAPVGGRPFLCWLLEYMAGQGVTRAVLCVHHRARDIMGHLGARHAGITLHYSLEERPLGTGGAIRRALHAFNPGEPVFVLNGDSLVEADYRRMLALHRQKGRRLTMAIRVVPDARRYSALKAEKGRIKQFTLLGAADPAAISVGFYVASPDLFKGYALPEVFSFERDFLEPHVPEIEPAAYAPVHYFLDIGVPEDYARALKEIPERLDIALAA